MAVYTEVRFDEADALFRRLGLGALTDLQGIRSGIENTNYYAATARGQWVLTLFERLSAEQLPYYLRLMEHLALQGIPVPAPQADADGELVHTLAGKPAAVVTRLPGSHRLAPDAAHCAQVGAMLARMHRAGASFTLQQPHLRGLAWWLETAPLVLPHLADGPAALLREELAFQQHLAASPAGQALPRGFFDFYFAGTDALLFDVAVCLNDWCSDPASGQLDEARAAVFTAAYERVRPFSAGEVRALPSLLRAAALRFWISRLWDWHLPRSATLLQAKDPAQFERVLRSRIATPWHPPR